MQTPFCKARGKIVSLHPSSDDAHETKKMETFALELKAPLGTQQYCSNASKEITGYTGASPTTYRPVAIP